MDLNTKVENGHTVVTLTGRLDAVTSPQCEQSFRDLVAAGARTVVIDFAALDYISSAGLRALLLLAKLLKEGNGKLCLAAATNNVRSVFEMSGFTGIFPVKETVADALAALA